ncbi:MAG: T9SS type A sorting domain-containing protein, partial [Bacteroidota bacterium]
IFPNPAQEDFVIRWENEVSVEEVTLYNAAGRLVAREKLDGSATKQRTVDVSQLPAGVYFVVLETDGVRIKEQVVVF